MFLSLSLLVLLYFNSNTRQSAWLPPDQNLAHRRTPPKGLLNNDV